MEIEAKQSYELTDLLGRKLGSILIGQVGERYCGTLTEGPDFDSVRDFFLRLEEAVDGQMLSILDDIDQQLEKLQPILMSERGSIRIFDLRIRSDQLVFFRTSPFLSTVHKPRR
jgi:hypothetical protein